MGEFVASETGLTWRGKGQTLEITGWGPDSLRVRATPNRTFAAAPSALVSDQGTAARVETRDGGAVVRSGMLEARVSPYGRIRFFREGSAEAILEETDWTPWAPPLHPEAREFRAVGGDLYHVEARFGASAGERFYGLGQHKHGLLDQKGAVIDLVQRNAEVCIPFLVSSRGYGVLWNHPGVGRVELGANVTRWVANGSRQVDYLVVTGASFAAIMERYADATGHAPPLPAWAAGFWQSKLRYSSQEELLGVAREFRRRDLPLAVIVVDFFHWTRHGEWKWDPVRWPDPAAMVRELDALGVRVMVSIWPTVNPRAATAAEMRERGLLVGTERGSDLLYPFMEIGEKRPTSLHYYDSTNPEARAYIWNRVKSSYHDKGISAYWLDACEPEMHPTDPENLRFHAGAGVEVACLYPWAHQQAFYQGMRAAGRQDVLNLSRSAWAGSQRWGAAVWSGDIRSDWASLRAQVRAGLNMGMSGIPWWTTDIGGFYGGNIEDPAFRELLIRWFQWGVFCPLFRLHGSRDPVQAEVAGCTDCPPSGAANEPWS
ncbi:MAG TPA: TIM-barrel domain-containing protein, partial [Spirochaetia bacterium]|nr:TIM-barrel domain-containing protein [Spirochaetia bacterium]